MLDIISQFLLQIIVIKMLCSLQKGGAEYTVSQSMPVKQNTLPTLPKPELQLSTQVKLLRVILD